MDPNTGRIENFKTDEAARVAGFIPIRRDLTAKEKAERKIRMYAPCGCGSGKKFKFCCHTANKGVQPRRPTPLADATGSALGTEEKCK